MVFWAAELLPRSELQHIEDLFCVSVPSTVQKSYKKKTYELVCTCTFRKFKSCSDNLDLFYGTLYLVPFSNPRPCYVHVNSQLFIIIIQ